jgi:hypothetical protein
MAVAVAVLAVGLGIGIVLGPFVFADGEDPTADTYPTAEPTTSAEVTFTAGGPGPSSPPPSPPPLTPEQEADLRAGIRSQEVPSSGSGELLVVSGSSDAPAGSAPISTVRVEVEDGLDIDGAAFAAFVMDTLNDPRGWGADGSVRFARTDGDADIRVVLATPSTVDAMCAPLATNGRWSCGRNGHAALNAERWVFGADAWLDGGGELTDYRQYLVNHEVGHLLGHPHEECPVPGEPAPVMVQQSISLDGCTPNGWPHP